MGSQTLKISNVEGKDQEEQVENGDPEKTNLMKEREYNLKYKRATSKVLGKIRYCIWNKNRVHSQGSITWTWMIVSGEFIISFVLSPQQKFEVTDGPVSWFSFIGKQRKTHPPGVRTCRPKRREEKPPRSILAPLFMFFPPPREPALCKLAVQEGCYFYLRSSLRYSDLPLFYFCGLFLLCLLATAILDSFFLF